MTREQAKQFLPIIAAFAEGKKVQFLDTLGTWKSSEEFGFDYDPSRYRIKPEPKLRP